MAADALRVLTDVLPGRIFSSGTDAYRRATTPRNTTASQRPLAVARVFSDQDVARCVRTAAEVGLRVVPQATGHGAAGSIGDDVVLVDTSALDTIEIDAQRKVVRVGAGATFGKVNAAAFRHGLLAPSGTAPDVAVLGYVALGGVGWLTRPHGLASAALRAVEVVDGAGRLVGPASEAYEDVLWACRGGGGAGIVTSVELELFGVEDLRAGYVLWPASLADEVLPAWGAALSGFNPALSSAVGLLHAPDAPSVPEALRGKPVVHLSAATLAGSAAEDSLRRLLADLPRPAISTLGPCDAARLATIHLDPPSATPALGEGRWLTAGAAEHVLDIVTAAGTDADSPLAEVELRHVAASGSQVPGALTSVPGDLVLHATGGAPDEGARRAVLDALQTVRDRARAVDAGVSAPAFRDGQAPDVDTHSPGVARRLAEIRQELDPTGVIGQARVPSGTLAR